MNFEDEHYVRVYTKDSKTWMRWGWEGQTVFMHLMRRLDKAGVLDDIEDPVPDVALITGLPEEVVAKGLPRLLDSGTLQHANRLLVAPRYIEGQTSKRSDAVRAKESRERRRQTAMLSQIVTDRHESEQPVTSRNASERSRSQVDDVTERDGAVTNRDQTSQSVTERHANPVPRHSTQYNADQRSATQSSDSARDPADPPSQVSHPRLESTRPDNHIPDTPARAPSVPPAPRRGDFRTLRPPEWSPSDPGVAYARELGLDDRDISETITELRNWKGTRAYTVDWWDTKWNTFVQNRAKWKNEPGSQRRGKLTHDPSEAARAREAMDFLRGDDEPVLAEVVG